MAGSDSAGREDGEHKGSRRAREWPIPKKCRIVEETFVPGASVSVVARRHDVNANLLFGWRKKYRQGTLVDRKAAPRAALPPPDLVRIGVVDHDGGIRSLPVVNGHSVPPPEKSGKATAPPADSVSVPGIIEIELPGGIKVRVDASIDEAALRRVLAVIKDMA
jgi:transposase